MRSTEVAIVCPTYQLLNIESQKVHIESQLTWKIKTVPDTMHGFE